MYKVYVLVTICVYVLVVNTNCMYLCLLVLCTSYVKLFYALVISTRMY